MPKTKISEFSSTPANNTDIDSINLAEGCAPSGINDAIRELMAQLKDFQTGAVGDSFNGPVGTTTAAAGAFTTLSSTGNTTLGDASGDSVTINGTATFANANPTLSAGTANGVAYLNGSKVVTSGSALTFDGSNVGVTASSSAGFVGITTQNTSAGAGASSGIGINNDSTASTYLRTYGSGQTNTLLGSVIANYTALLSDGAASNGILLGSLTNKPVIFGVNNAEGMRLTSTGLGIGTSSPLAKIHANNSSSGATALTAIFGNGASAALNNGSAIFLNNSSSFNASAYSARIASVITNASTQASDLIFGLYNGSSGSDLMRLDSSGNLGLGVTPSAWASVKAIQYINGAAWGIGTTDSGLSHNAYFSGGWKYISSSAASTLYAMSSGAHAWSVAASGTAGNTITFTQAMTLDASGNLAVGKTSQTGNSKVSVQASASTASFSALVGSAGNTGYVFDSGNYGFIDYNSGAGTGYVRISAINDGGSYQNPIVFGHNTNAAYGSSTFTERARIDSSGNLLVGTTSAGGRLTVVAGSAIQSPIATSSVTGDTTYQAILVTKFDNNSTTSQNFIQFQINNGAANCGKITANGANTAAFGSTSDQRVKENIVELPSQLANIMALRPVEFDYIESYGGGHQIGFIAQEMQQVYPDVIAEDESEEKILSITGWSKTEARLVKAIQEQQAIIESLKARLDAANL